MKQQLENKNWLVSLFETIDRMDAGQFVSYLTEDATFRFGNFPSVNSKSLIKKSVKDFFSGIEGLSHEIYKTLDFEDVVVVEGKVSYHLNGKTISVPFCNIFEMKNELIKEYKIYIDISPLLSEQQSNEK